MAMGFLDHLAVVAVSDSRCGAYSKRNEGWWNYGEYRSRRSALDVLLAFMDMCPHCFLYGRLLYGGSIVHSGESMGNQQKTIPYDSRSLQNT